AYPTPFTCAYLLFLSILWRPLISTPFPYTTLFRSRIRCFIDLRRCRHLDDASLVHDGDTVGHRHRLFLVVGDDQEGHAEGDLERSEEHTSELQSRENLVCRLLLEKKNNHSSRVTDT